MIILTDTPEFFQNFSAEIKPHWADANRGEATENLLRQQFFKEGIIRKGILDSPNFKLWDFGIFVDIAPKSQYDQLISLCQNNRLPGINLICHADSGRRFHGFHGRKWETKPGNIHLSVLLSPEKQIKNYATCFTILSAVSVLQTLNSIGELRNKPRIRWVNDIVIDHAKISGVLAHTFSQGNIVLSAILGIGINIENRPDVLPDRFTPSIVALNELTTIRYSSQQFLEILLKILRENYRVILQGGYEELVDIYRENSMIIGKETEIYDENGNLIIRGKVTDIGDNLELYFRGKSEPVTKGRPVIL